MAFGVYVHIPYCLQRCVYCDFATYEFSQILEPSDYVKRVQKEIKTRGPQIGPQPMDTLYFGGGTPSLLEPELLGKIVNSLKDAGFELRPSAEVTLEINPATIDEAKLEKLIDLGFNRFSVGAQTFDDELLKLAHRRHTAEQTKETLRLLKSRGLNYSFDLLFALPKQNLDHLKRDIAIAMEFSPSHVSPYCLTVPESNPMAKNRAPENEQVQMFDLIKTELERFGLSRYEISNFSRPGYESQHNMLYWDDEEYWGLGLSAHSYMKWGSWGTRFWNPRSMPLYLEKTQLPWDEADDHEELQRHQALTDYFHISLRKNAGLEKSAFHHKFKESVSTLAGGQIGKMVNRGLLRETPTHLQLTEEGLVLSNKVFEEFTFLKGATG